jgi:hypothetical protein
MGGFMGAGIGGSPAGELLDSGTILPMQQTQKPGPMTQAPPPTQGSPAPPVAETGGPSGPEPTRYGDWERNGRCVDF